jgi:hypothetical protein
MGPAGPGGWADAGGPERVGPSGSARSSRIGFFIFLFSEIISSAKTLTVKSSKCLQGKNILRKSQKFQENS